MPKYLTAIVVGTVIGIVSPRYLLTGPTSLVVAGLVAVVLGLWCNRRESIIVGALYGFCFSMAVLTAGYTSTAMLGTRLVFFVFLAAFGAICGIALSVTGYFLRLRFAGPRKLAG
jgi:hypothetical protein